MEINLFQIKRTPVINTLSVVEGSFLLTHMQNHDYCMFSHV